MRSVIFQGSSCYHVQLRMFGTASLLFSVLSDSGIRPTVFQWVFVRTSLC